ncbi:MAG: helix-turn-helix domain-containing protein, partial [Candidatus Methylomirabilales bacterium]
LRSMVAMGKFREDLFYRLEVIPISVPPLRQRKEDIPLLVEHFMSRFNRNNIKQVRRVTSRAMEALLRYEWPGNIRELENVIERAAILASGDVLDLDDLPQSLRPGLAGVPSATSDLEAWPRRLKEVERDLIRTTLGNLGRNRRTRAAELLGISLKSLQNKLARYWPENVRELETLWGELGAATAEGESSDVGESDPRAHRDRYSHHLDREPWARSLREAERDIILKTLSRALGNWSLAAELLGISLKELHSKAAQYQGEKADHR